MGAGSWTYPICQSKSSRLKPTTTTTPSNRLNRRSPKELPDLIAEHPNLARLFFAPGLLIELLFFLGLLGRRWSAGMGLAAIGLHRSIELLMGLDFESHEVLLWIFFVNVPYWIAKGVALAFGRLRIAQGAQPN